MVTLQAEDDNNHANNHEILSWGLFWFVPAHLVEENNMDGTMYNL